MKTALSSVLGSACVLILLHVDAGLGQAVTPAVIPLVPGLTIVMAAHNATPPGPASVKGIAQGDYELVVSVTGVSASGIDETTSVEAEDENHKPLQLTIRRHVLATDLAGSRLQLLGFHTDDPQEIPGTTSLGPSLSITRDLRTTGRAPYSVMNFLKQATSTGTLTRVGTESVPFPVILNGRRTTLPAMRVAGLLKYGDKVRPWEQYIFDDPKHPLTLRFAHGAVGASAGFTPEFADLLRRQPQWRLSIEGHTDNSGGDAYNQDLSARRAASVKEALVRDFAIGSTRVTTAGFGARRPVETNDTIAGRAHNRRVELVRDCPGK